MVYEIWAKLNNGKSIRLTTKFRRDIAEERQAQEEEAQRYEQVWIKTIDDQPVR